MVSDTADPQHVQIGQLGALLVRSCDRPATASSGGVGHHGPTVLDLPSREAALEWAAKIAKACRCNQEVREFMPDPEVGN